jgi:cyclic nucleotide gated channel alpha 3
LKFFRSLAKFTFICDLLKNNFCRKRLARLLKPNRSFQVNTNDNENLKEILLKTTPNLVRQSQSSAQQIVIEELNDKETKTIWELISFQLMKNFNCKFEINPLNQPYYFWLIVISLCYLYNLIFLIARTAFWLLQDGAMSTWFFFDYFVSDFVYILDVLIRFNTGYMENGEICMDKLKIFKKYIKTFQFKIDVLSIFPIEIFSFLLFPENESRFKVALRLNRLLRFGRFFEFRSITETQTKYPTVFRMSNLILNILIAMHWNGCIYFLISNFLGFGSDSWVFPTLTSPNITLNLTSAELHNMLLTHELGTQYIYCFWWSVQTLSTIAEVPPPTTYYEEIYMTILLMIGVVILAITIGSAGDMVENANRQKLELQQKCDYAKSFLNQHRITGTLEMRVKNYLNYLWITSDANLADDLGTLPSNLRKAIAMDVHMDTLKRVHVFQDCEPGLLGELVTKLKLQIYSPGDYVCRKGDVGHEVIIFLE